MPTTPEPTFIDMGVGPTLFADRMKIEPAGVVTHLLFAQRQTMDNRPIDALQVRLIVPTQLLVRMARQLALPAANPVQLLTHDESDSPVLN
jgi:hypothetical protein